MVRTCILVSLFSFSTISIFDRHTKFFLCPCWERACESASNAGSILFLVDHKVLLTYQKLERLLSKKKIPSDWMHGIFIFSWVVFCVHIPVFLSSYILWIEQKYVQGLSIISRTAHARAFSIKCIPKTNINDTSRTPSFFSVRFSSFFFCFFVRFAPALSLSVCTHIFCYRLQNWDFFFQNGY